jgi:hypothetical protein
MFLNEYDNFCHVHIQNNFILCGKYVEEFHSIFRVVSVDVKHLHFLDTC